MVAAIWDSGRTLVAMVEFLACAVFVILPLWRQIERVWDRVGMTMESATSYESTREYANDLISADAQMVFLLTALGAVLYFAVVLNRYILGGSAL
jgi:hypothetical protein